MAYYSFVVIAPQPVGITQPMLMLDTGMNVFNVEVDDLDLLLARFKEEGVIVKQRNRLDAFDPGHVTDLLVEDGCTCEAREAREADPACSVVHAFWCAANGPVGPYVEANPPPVLEGCTCRANQEYDPNSPGPVIHGTGCLRIGRLIIETET